MKNYYWFPHPRINVYPSRVDLDEYYVRNWTLKLDVIQIVNVVLLSNGVC
jgi:hypothetical protein